MLLYLEVIHFDKVDLRKNKKHSALSQGLSLAAVTLAFCPVVWS